MPTPNSATGHAGARDTWPIASELAFVRQGGARRLDILRARGGMAHAPQRFMKKKTRRKLKKALKSASKALQQLDPALLGRASALAAGGATAGSVLLAAARDPRIQESARELVAAVSDFLERATTQRDDASSAAHGAKSLERH